MASPDNTGETPPGSPGRPTISVVVPVYNSQDTLRPLVERLEAVLERIASGFEVILVNDASRDDSWRVVTELARQRPWVRGYNLMRNYGQHNALLCGIRAARHELIVTLDDDLQNPPEEISKMLERLSDEYDVVYGAPLQEQHGLWRDAASRITKLALQSAMGAKTARYVSTFRIFRTHVREAFENFASPFLSIDVLLTWGTSRFTVVRVAHEPRTIGVSNYTFGKLLLHALNMTTGLSTMPLRLASWIGFSFTLLGVVVLAYVVLGVFLWGIPVRGFPFLASIVAVFSGAQLFALGILGEYMARIHFRVMDKPTYVVREAVEADSEGD